MPKGLRILHLSLGERNLTHFGGIFLIHQFIGLKKFPYASSLRRFLKRVKPKVIQGISKVHDQLRLKMFYVPKPRTSLLFDLDSSVLTLYGKFIEGAEVGYNPHKRGARSYHPLLCFEYNSRDFWHGLLRPGNVYTSSGAPAFFKYGPERVPRGILGSGGRADSGFFDHKFIEPLDQEGIGYVIVAKMTRPIKNKIGNLRYYRFKNNWGAAEF